MNVPGHVVRAVTHADAAAIQALFATDLEYFPVVEGAPLRDDEGHQIIDEVPPEFPRENKRIYLVDGIAILDMLEGYPDAHTWFLGLIFIAPAARGKGLGTKLMTAVRDHVRAHGATKLRLAVAHANPGAERLYKRLGFQFVARRKRTVYTGAVVELDVLELTV